MTDLYPTLLLTVNGGQTDSEKLKHPQKTEGCHTSVCEDRESRRGQFKTTSFSMREWHHLLDARLLRVNTGCGERVHVSVCCNLGERAVSIGGIRGGV